VGRAYLNHAQTITGSGKRIVMGKHEQTGSAPVTTDSDEVKAWQHYRNAVDIEDELWYTDEMQDAIGRGEIPQLMRDAAAETNRCYQAYLTVRSGKRLGSVKNHQWLGICWCGKTHVSLDEIRKLNA
jgi:hypothetical protein